MQILIMNFQHGSCIYEVVSLIHLNHTKNSQDLLAYNGQKQKLLQTALHSTIKIQGFLIYFQEPKS